MFVTFSEYSASSFSFSASSSLIFLTSALIFSASSFLPSRINPPICVLSEFLWALNSSPWSFNSLFLLSSSITSSTRGNLCIWNLFLIFCLTISGFSLKNLISIIIISFQIIYLYNLYLYLHIIQIYVIDQLYYQVFQE